jgi:hypothetical protein
MQSEPFRESTSPEIKVPLEIGAHFSQNLGQSVMKGGTLGGRTGKALPEPIDHYPAADWTTV